ncbi:protein of unknown function [Stenotrophomonas maltophilia]|nr:protein of unknown function [Stenotrophomonas maltophilia]
MIRDGRDGWAFAGHAVNPSMGARSPHPCGERSCKGPPAPPVRFPAGADGKGGIKGKSKSKKAADGCLFCFRERRVGVGSLCVAKGSDPGL